MTLLQITTIDRVKALAGISSTVSDTELTALVASVSQRFESYIGQPFMQSTRTREYNVQPRLNTVNLETFPVQSITSIKNDARWDWASTTAISSDLYHLDGAAGKVYLDYDLWPGARAVQIIFEAGFATTTTAFIAAYPAISQAADFQVIDEWRRRNNPAGSAKSLGGSKTEYVSALKLLPEAVEALAPYRVIAFGL